jgi:hypothetical protein
MATVQQRRNVLVSDMGIVDEVDENGVGGAIGVRLGLLYMPLPDPVLSQGVFPAFRLGIGLDSHFLYDRRPVGFVGTGGREAQYEDEALWVMNGMPQVGLHLGLGRFKTENTWRGAVIGIAYSPALQYEKNFRDVEGEFRFNYAGAELTVDITKITTVTTDPQGESQIRFILLGLAPIDDDHPALASVGIGVAWY